MALSDLTARQARTTGKRYILSDNDCLGLMVSAAGGKSWIFRYYWLGKQKRMSLGEYTFKSVRATDSETGWPLNLRAVRIAGLQVVSAESNGKKAERER